MVYCKCHHDHNGKWEPNLLCTRKVHRITTRIDGGVHFSVHSSSVKYLHLLPFFGIDIIIWYVVLPCHYHTRIVVISLCNLWTLLKILFSNIRPHSKTVSLHFCQIQIIPSKSLYAGRHTVAALEIQYAIFIKPVSFWFYINKVGEEKYYGYYNK